MNNTKREKLKRGSQGEGERRGQRCEDAVPLTPSPLSWEPPTLNVRIVLGAKNFVLCLTSSFLRCEEPSVVKEAILEFLWITCAVVIFPWHIFFFPFQKGQVRTDSRMRSLILWCLLSNNQRTLPGRLDAGSWGEVVEVRPPGVSTL